MNHKPVSLFILLIGCLISSSSFGQTVVEITSLTNQLIESSGMIRIDSKLITHNDSGGQAALFEIDTISGEPSRTVVISNADNIDWEDICKDDEFIYIGDFGNNQGTRSDLKIYKIAISDYLDTSDNIVSAEVIEFDYADQTDFTPSAFSTNFDAEAMISNGDQLHVFTKNWGNNWTNIYSIPKTPGDYSVQKVDSINIEGMVTGAVYDAGNEKIILTGYSILLAPFLVQLTEFSDGPPSQGGITKVNLQMPQGFSSQIEGIITGDNTTIYLTSEESFTGVSGLFRTQLDINLNTTEITKSEKPIYPNPSSDVVALSIEDLAYIELFDETGKQVLNSKQATFSVSTLPNGVYTVKIHIQGQQKFSIQKLIVSH